MITNETKEFSIKTRIRIRKGSERLLYLWFEEPDIEQVILSLVFQYEVKVKEVISFEVFSNNIDSDTRSDSRYAGEDIYILPEYPGEFETNSLPFPE